MKMYTVNYIDRNDKGQIVRVMADSKIHAHNRAIARGAIEIISVEITPPADRISKHLTREGGLIGATEEYLTLKNKKA